MLVALMAGGTGCASGPTPRAWAASVCEALGPWRAEIGSLTARTREQMTAATTPAQAKENLVRLFGGAQAASETARSRVEQAGVPDTDGGDAVAAGFLASLTAVRDAYGKARDSIEKLATARASEFYDGVEAVMKVLDSEYGRSALDTTKLDSPELKQAFDEVPECH
ncbi:MAG TPA: hypothetical protein VFR67_22560 [Pilimelia sp.]|nr:hypothetical protein [Pilimelia sp.]